MAGLCPIVIGFRRSPFQLIQSRRKCGCYIQGAYGGRITVVFFYYCVARLYHCGDIGCAPINQAPVNQAPVNQTPVNQTPVNQAPVNQTPVNPAPAGMENWEFFNRLEREERESGQPDRLWQHFRKTYPKIQAFDYANGCEILMVKPQDIGLLPRETWTYGNNSFLLHGYYSYRYLILVKLNNPEGNPRYLLGVPGHYYSNEKYMASMFGFPNFVLSKLQPAGDARFGYWYTDINMGNQ